MPKFPGNNPLMRLSFWWARAVFAAIVDPIIAQHGATVTSWDRSVEHNASDDVGGLRFSFHLVGLAKDCWREDWWNTANGTVDRQAFMHDCLEVGLEAVDEGDHVHVEFDLKSLLRKLVVAENNDRDVLA